MAKPPRLSLKLSRSQAVASTGPIEKFSELTNTPPDHGGPMKLFNAHVIVSGRVQGVFFRESTRRRAETLGLSGFVRNLPDGRVEAYFAGDEHAVRGALEFVRRGPPSARVDDVQIDLNPAQGADPSGPGGFQIR